MLWKFADFSVFESAADFYFYFTSDRRPDLSGMRTCFQKSTSNWDRMEVTLSKGIGSTASTHPVGKVIRGRGRGRICYNKIKVKQRKTQ